MVEEGAKSAGDVVKPGETVEVVILGVNAAERRISLGLKQALGDPWAEVPQKFPVGSRSRRAGDQPDQIRRLRAACRRRRGHDPHQRDQRREAHQSPAGRAEGRTSWSRRRCSKSTTKSGTLRLGMKQLVPSSLDEYIAEHKEGDVVTGRMTEASGGIARVELGEGVQGTCRLDSQLPAKEETQAETKADLSSLTSMLNARWKGGDTGGASNPAEVSAGVIRTFRISKLDPAAKKIELEFAGQA